jgi:hypothetical protein
MLPCSLATLMVASIYYVWRAYNEFQQRRTQTLRQRVSYMLWVMADQMD